jgi:predicted nucleic acid-binding protein
MIVDANVAVYWFVSTALSGRAASLLMRDDLVAPKLARLEVARSLISYVQAALISREQALSAIDRVGGYFAELVDDETLFRQAVDLSINYRHIVYDCLYLALALERRLPLATADRRLAALAERLGVETLLIEPE